MADRKPFKLWFDEALVHELAAGFCSVEPTFDEGRFVELALPGLQDLEMMARVAQIADAMRAGLPSSISRALEALVATLPPATTETDGITERGYRFWSYGAFIAKYARCERSAAFEAMHELTMRFTSEFAVRSFLADDVHDALDRLERGLDHPNPHVRRWVSEGTRTRLPWGKAVPALREVSGRRLGLLRALRRDPSRYVQRSVANHLQDALKDDLDQAWPLLAELVAEEHPATVWIARHAARGLLKAGHGPTLGLFGHAEGPSPFRAVLRVEPGVVHAGEAVEIVVELHNAGPRAAVARVDYILGFPTPAGGTGRRTFRLGDRRVEAGGRATLRKRHRFVDRSTRPLLAGPHPIALRVDGDDAGSALVEVVKR